MTTVATENCVTYLATQGMNISDILVSKPTVPMRSLCLTNFKIGKDVACQTDTSNTSSEDWFEEFLEEMDLTETVLDTCLTEVIKDLKNWCLRLYRTNSSIHTAWRIKLPCFETAKTVAIQPFKDWRSNTKIPSHLNYLSRNFTEHLKILFFSVLAFTWMREYTWPSMASETFMEILSKHHYRRRHLCLDTTTANNVTFIHIRTTLITLYFLFITCYFMCSWVWHVLIIHFKYAFCLECFWTVET